MNCTTHHICECKQAELDEWKKRALYYEESCVKWADQFIELNKKKDNILEKLKYLESLIKK